VGLPPLLHHSRCVYSKIGGKPTFLTYDPASLFIRGALALRLPRQSVISRSNPFACALPHPRD
jgi:hypothetical protein